MNKRIPLTIIAFAVVGCILISALAVTAVVLLARNPPAPTSQPSIIPTPDPFADVSTQMDQIQTEVIGIRGLEPSGPVNRDVITPEELRLKVMNDFFKDYLPEDAANDARVLAAFGLLPPNFDLITFFNELYSEQIAGFYDTETKEMYIVQGEAFQGTERMTYSHEYTHVLQDQNYDLYNGLKLNDEYCKNQTEYCAAATALIEGDASMTEQIWLRKYSTDKDKQQIQDFYSTYSSPVFDRSPDFIKLDLLFPYQQGLDFVNYWYARDQFNAIDRMYQNPPVSTEQILHPDHYPNDLPEEVFLPDIAAVLGEDWKQTEGNLMGEWYSYLILAAGDNASARVPNSEARTAVDGWTGDTYIACWNESTQSFALVWRTHWDTIVDTAEFWAALEKYGTARWGEPDERQANEIKWSSTVDGVVDLQRSDNEVWWIMLPSASEFDTITSILPIGK